MSFLCFHPIELSPTIYAHPPPPTTTPPQQQSHSHPRGCRCAKNVFQQYTLFWVIERKITLCPMVAAGVVEAANLPRYGYRVRDSEITGGRRHDAKRKIFTAPIVDTTTTTLRLRRQRELDQAVHALLVENHVGRACVPSAEVPLHARLRGGVGVAHEWLEGAAHGERVPYTQPGCHRGVARLPVLVREDFE